MMIIIHAGFDTILASHVRILVLHDHLIITNDHDLVLLSRSSLITNHSSNLGSVTMVLKAFFFDDPGPTALSLNTIIIHY
jgi:hypothetical protein